MGIYFFLILSLLLSCGVSVHAVKTSHRFKAVQRGVLQFHKDIRCMYSGIFSSFYFEEEHESVFMSSKSTGYSQMSLLKVQID